MRASACRFSRLNQRRVIASLLVAAAAALLFLLLLRRKGVESDNWRSIAANGDVAAANTRNGAARTEATFVRRVPLTRQPAAAAASRRLVASRPVVCWRVRAAETTTNTATSQGEDRIVCFPAARDGTAVPAQASSSASAADVSSVGKAARSRPLADYAFVACFSSSTLRSAASRGVLISSMTVERCLRACDDSRHAYAALEEADTCICLAERPTTRLLPDRSCQLPCTGNRRWLCGGHSSAAIYHLRSRDGGAEWTAWMVSPRGDGASGTGQVAVRFRDCTALQSDASEKHLVRRCQVKLERRLIASSHPWTSPLSPLLRHFVGCYAVASDPPDAHLATSRKKARVAAATADCLHACADLGFSYAFFRFTDGCFCSRTLGVSRPVEFCDAEYGLPFYVVRAPPEETVVDKSHLCDGRARPTVDAGQAAYSTAVGGCDDAGGGGKNCSNQRDIDYRRRVVSERDDNNSSSSSSAATALTRAESQRAINRTTNVSSDICITVELLFDQPPSNKRRVLLLAYHRSGSTYASELVSKHPGALYTFEPDIIYGSTRFALGKYDDTEQLHREFYRGFERFLFCDVHRLPLIWMTLGSFFPRTFEHSPRMAAYIGCVRAHGPVACVPYFQAQCEAASIISAKTIRLTATLQTEAFVRANPSLVVLHLMRDPRAVASSRKLVGAFTVDGVQRLCDSMQRTALFVNRSQAATSSGDHRGRLFNVYYEDLVLEPLRSARYIYASMLRLNISKSTEWRLRVITGEQHDGGPDVRLLRRYTTRKRDPEKSLLKWQQQLSAREQAVVRSRCVAVLRWYPSSKYFNTSSPAARR